MGPRILLLFSFLIVVTHSAIGAPPTGSQQNLSLSELYNLIQQLTKRVEHLELSPSSKGIQPPNQHKEIRQQLNSLQDEVSKIQSELSQVKNATASSSNISSLFVQSVMEDKIRDLIKRVDAIKLEISQENAKQFEILNTQAQTLLNILNTALASLTQQINEIKAHIKQQDELGAIREAERKSVIISECVAAIIDGSTVLALNKFKQLGEFIPKGYVDTDIHEIIRSAYSQAGAYDNIISFIRGLPQFTTTAMALDALLNELCTKDNLVSRQGIRFALTVRDTMNNSNYPKTFEWVRNMMDRLKAAIPIGIKNLVWGNVCLFNTGWSEYLYADGFYKHDRDRRSVFTWTLRNTNSIEAKWKFETNDNGKTFFIKNVDWNEYLYSSIQKYNNDRRYIFTWVPGLFDLTDSERAWDVNPTSAKDVEIRSVRYNEMVYAAFDSFNYNSVRRRVFSWVPGNAVAKSDWEVRAC
jgi:chaperonin cofactor prefoldin